MLKDKAGLWKSDDEFTFFDHFLICCNLIRIQQVSTRKVLGSQNDDEVVLEDSIQDSFSQLWTKGKPDAEGYFTLENEKLSKTGPKILTAISSGILKVKGNII